MDINNHKSSSRIFMRWVWGAITTGTLILASCSTMNMNTLMSGAEKAVQAASVSDAQIQSYVAEYIKYSDTQNKVAPADNPYAIRLAKLTNGLTSVDGIPLNFKVYLTNDVNAFACADGSVRVYSGLMDKMTDDEVLGVIGHEIGHVAHKDTKHAFKQALINSAILDGIASTSNSMAALSQTQLAKIGESLVSARYSQKQESNADDYGYDFLKSNGKNPWAMAMAFTKLEQMEGGATTQSNGLSQMFSSHPSTAARIQHIVERCNKDKVAKPAGCTL